MASLTFAAFLKDPKPVAVGFVRRYRVAFWLVMGWMLLSGLAMRPSEATVVILVVDLLLLWLAVSLFKGSRTSLWLAIAAQVLAATQMTPNRAAALVLILNMTLMLGAIVAARLGASEKDA